MQQAVEKELEVWAAEWEVGAVRREPVWSLFAVELLPDRLLLSFERALRSFPDLTGLGWDSLHPKALLRLPDALLEAVISLLHMCECQGRWPECIELPITVLRPKPGGGFRPIGLLPTLARIWSRARRAASLEWERQHSSGYMYAGEAKGATVAAWKQAARAEHAIALKVDYGQALLGLAKAFERIPHHVLVREAAALGYPGRLIRLAVATCKMLRVLRVGQSLSQEVVAVCGITAGSGSATTEMRITMMRIVDRALFAQPSVGPTLFVDVLGAEVAGSQRWFRRQLGGSVLEVCREVAEAGMEISVKKSVFFCVVGGVGGGFAVGLGGLWCVVCEAGYGVGVGAWGWRAAEREGAQGSVEAVKEEEV